MATARGRDILALYYIMGYGRSAHTVRLLIYGKLKYIVIIYFNV